MENQGFFVCFLLLLLVSISNHRWPPLIRHATSHTSSLRMRHAYLSSCKDRETRKAWVSSSLQHCRTVESCSVMTDTALQRVNSGSSSTKHSPITPSITYLSTNLSLWSCSLTSSIRLQIFLFKSDIKITSNAIKSISISFKINNCLNQKEKRRCWKISVAPGLPLSPSEENSADCICKHTHTMQQPLLGMFTSHTCVIYWQWWKYIMFWINNRTLLE